MTKLIIFLLGACSIVFSIFAFDCNNNLDIKLIDGTYQGSFSSVVVLVTVKDEKVEGIKIISHTTNSNKYENLVSRVSNEIIACQSTNVDAVSGATISSENVIKAVEDALTKAIDSN